MKKQIKLTFLLTVLMSMVGTRVFAHDIEVTNNDGVRIYYNYTGTSLEVTYRGSSYLAYENEYSGNVVIPEEVTVPSGTRKVTSIGSSAFKHSSRLTSVTIPNSVTSISGDAFYGCEGLTSVTIPNSVTTIAIDAFRYCSGLTSITIGNSVTSIGNGAFSYCSGLTSVTIPNSVTSIGVDAFFFCYNLTSVTIPNSVTTIGRGAFGGCRGLTSITVEEGNSKYDSRDNCNAIIEKTTNTLVVGCKNTVIPNSVTSIGTYAFYGCSSLTSFTIPNSVTSIGDYAFCQCIGLTSVTIPNSVTTIGKGAFEIADIPTVISLIENPFAINGKSSDYRTFSQNTFDNATLYVPKGTIDKYKATEGWKDFRHIEEGEPSGITNIGCEVGKELIRYTLDGKIAKSSHKGINIIQMDNGTTKKVVVK